MRIDGGIDTHQLEHSAECGRGRGAVEVVPVMSRHPKDPKENMQQLVYLGVHLSILGMVHDAFTPDREACCIK